MVPFLGVLSFSYLFSRLQDMYSSAIFPWYDCQFLDAGDTTLKNLSKVRIFPCPLWALLVLSPFQPHYGFDSSDEQVCDEREEKTSTSMPALRNGMKISMVLTVLAI